MTSLTPQQTKRLEALAKYTKDKDISVLEQFLEIQEKLGDHKECMEEMLSDIKDIKDKEMPVPTDYSQELNDIKAKLDEDEEIIVQLEII